MKVKTHTAILLILVLIAGSCVSRRTQGPPANTVVKARQWSKSDDVVHYSGWKRYPVRETDAVSGFDTAGRETLTRYGGDPGRRVEATGFYRTIKTGDRWWIVDPEGYLQWNAAVNGVRPGPSPGNRQALTAKYGEEAVWTRETLKDLRSFGFNGTACWSETSLIQEANKSLVGSPVCYTLIWNFFSSYQRSRKQKGATGISFDVFSPGFEMHCETLGPRIALTKGDSNLLGHFSDNELSFSLKILDEFLAIGNSSDPNRIAAEAWIKSKGISPPAIHDRDREEFLGVVAGRYYQTVARVLKKYDPDHLYLGSRLHGRPKHNRYIVEAAGKSCDIVSINYYGHWEPVGKHFREWEQWSGKPVLITEFYTKGDDSGLPNNSGAGWRVATQEERGKHYENFCIVLLGMKNCVGAHWFRYMDNDPGDTTADPSNNDSNKGIVDNGYHYYQPLLSRMNNFNRNRYGLIRFFDHSH